MAGKDTRPAQTGSGGREMNTTKKVSEDGQPATRIVYREREAPNKTGFGNPNHKGK